MQRLALIILVPILVCTEAKAAEQPARVSALKITVLDTNVAGEPWAGDAEWGFSALVEVDGHRYLYDTGASPEMVLKNAKALKIDLSDIEDVILSHNHKDHTGGLLALRRELSQTNPKAMSRVHVGKGIFEPRWKKDGTDGNYLRQIREEYLATGGEFIVHEKPAELVPGVWLLTPIPRLHREQNWQRGVEVDGPNGRVEDTLAEDAAFAFVTREGVVILTGCGHAGIVNISEEARRVSANAPLLAVVGGLHLYNADERTLTWTGNELQKFGARYLLGAHCTGMEATFQLRRLTKMNRDTATVAGVGSTFTLEQGIKGLSLSH